MILHDIHNSTRLKMEEIKNNMSQQEREEFLIGARQREQERRITTNEEENIYLTSYLI